MTTCRQSLKKVAWAAVGLSERAKEIIGEFETRGEASESRGALRLKRVFKSIEKREDQFDQKMEAFKARLCGKIRLLRRDDIDRLEEKISNLSDRFRRWEEAKKEEG